MNKSIKKVVRVWVTSSVSQSGNAQVDTIQNTGLLRMDIEYSNHYW